MNNSQRDEDLGNFEEKIGVHYRDVGLAENIAVINDSKELLITKFNQQKNWSIHVTNTEEFSHSRY